jgi:putative RNA 2'-phosphotransferase
MATLIPDYKRLSKFLALVLRHQAAPFGLSLNAGGFTDTESVWKQIQKRYPDAYTYDDLLKVVEGDNTGKKRYEIVGTQIRALFGHSDVTPVVYPAADPPDVLYHGTMRGALDSIREHGLRAESRQYVHLTSSEQRATIVAARHSRDTVILTIRARDAHEAGIVFHHPEAEHWLAAAIPPMYIDFPSSL